MTEPNQNPPAADPAKDHETPGGNPVEEHRPQPGPQPQPETPEAQPEAAPQEQAPQEQDSELNATQPNGDLNGVRTATEDPSQSEGDVSDQSGRAGL